LRDLPDYSTFTAERLARICQNAVTHKVFNETTRCTKSFRLPRDAVSEFADANRFWTSVNSRENLFDVLRLFPSGPRSHKFPLSNFEWDALRAFAHAGNTCPTFGAAHHIRLLNSAVRKSF
jgi:hypothetical protein